MKNADRTAMPNRSQSHDNQFGGLTKREMIAMHAMQGLLADGEHCSDAISAQEWTKNITEASVEFADALLKELEE